jgi:hypothetical protein
MTDWRDQSWNWWEKERRDAATARAEQAEAAEARVQSILDAARDVVRAAFGDVIPKLKALEAAIAALDGESPASITDETRADLAGLPPGALSLPVGARVMVDLSAGVEQEGEIVRVVPTDGDDPWEYDVRVRGGAVIAAQPAHVREIAPDEFAQRLAEGGPEGEVVGFHRVQTPAGERVVYHHADEEPENPGGVPAQQWLRCPNEPPCPHAAVVHDIYDYAKPSPRCCVLGCDCGRSAQPVGGPEGEGAANHSLAGIEYDEHMGWARSRCSCGWEGDWSDEGGQREEHAAHAQLPAPAALDGGQPATGEQSNA